jgi:thiamine pyrophosphokinase
MPCDSLTVSNQFVDDEVKISFVNGRIVIMETKD